MPSSVSYAQAASKPATKPADTGGVSGVSSSSTTTSPVKEGISPSSNAESRASAVSSPIKSSANNGVDPISEVDESIVCRGQTEAEVGITVMPAADDHDCEPVNDHNEPRPTPCKSQGDEVSDIADANTGRQSHRPRENHEEVLQDSVDEKMSEKRNGEDKEEAKQVEYAPAPIPTVNPWYARRRGTTGATSAGAPTTTNMTNDAPGTAPSSITNGTSAITITLPNTTNDVGRQEHGRRATASAVNTVSTDTTSVLSRTPSLPNNDDPSAWPVLNDEVKPNKSSQPVKVQQVNGSSNDAPTNGGKSKTKWEKVVLEHNNLFSPIQNRGPRHRQAGGKPGKENSHKGGQTSGVGSGNYGSGHPTSKAENIKPRVHDGHLGRTGSRARSNNSPSGPKGVSVGDAGPRRHSADATREGTEIASVGVRIFLFSFSSNNNADANFTEQSGNKQQHKARGDANGPDHGGTGHINHAKYHGNNHNRDSMPNGRDRDGHRPDRHRGGHRYRASNHNGGSSGAGHHSATHASGPGNGYFNGSRQNMSHFSANVNNPQGFGRGSGVSRSRGAHRAQFGNGGALGPMVNGMSFSSSNTNGMHSRVIPPNIDPNFNGFYTVPPGPMTAPLSQYGTSQFGVDRELNGVGRCSEADISQVPAGLGAIQHQIDFWFTDENLPKDKFLREHMEKHGFVLLDVVLGFSRLREMQASREDCRIAIQRSDKIDLFCSRQDNKERIRIRENPEKWIFPADQRDAGTTDVNIDDMYLVEVEDPELQMQMQAQWYSSQPYVLESGINGSQYYPNHPNMVNITPHDAGLYPFAHQVPSHLVVQHHSAGHTRRLTADAPVWTPSSMS